MSEERLRSDLNMMRFQRNTNIRRIRELETENQEQARLLDMSAERELKLQARIEELKKCMKTPRVEDMQRIEQLEGMRDSLYETCERLREERMGLKQRIEELEAELDKAIAQCLQARADNEQLQQKLKNALNNYGLPIEDRNEYF